MKLRSVFCAFLCLFVAIAATSAATVNLAWKDNSTNEAGFRVLRATGANGALQQIGGADLAPNTVAYSDTTAAVSTTYRYQVVAFNGAGSNGSNIATITTATPETPPPAPSNLVVTEVLVAIDARGNVKTVATLQIDGQETQTATLEGQVKRRFRWFWQKRDET